MKNKRKIRATRFCIALGAEEEEEEEVEEEEEEEEEEEDEEEDEGSFSLHGYACKPAASRLS
jgi:hypothetical protein